MARKRDSITLAGGTVPVRQKRPGRLKKDDPRLVALKARRRQSGMDTLDPLSFTGPHSGHDMGKVLDHVFMRLPLEQGKRPARDTISALWGTFTHWCAVEEIYYRRILGVSAFPKGAAIAVMPEVIEATEAHEADTRTPERKDEDAKNAWLFWQDCLSQIEWDQRVALSHARLGTKELWVMDWSDEGRRSMYDAWVRDTQRQIQIAKTSGDDDTASRLTKVLEDAEKTAPKRAGASWGPTYTGMLALRGLEALHELVKAG